MELKLQKNKRSLGIIFENCKSTDIYSAQQAWDPNRGMGVEWVDNEVDLYKTNEYQLSWQNNVELDYGSIVLLYDFLKEEIETTDIYDKDQRINNGFVIGYNLPI